MSIRRHNWYLGRQVLDSDLDETSDWIVDGFEAAAIDNALAQDDAASSPARFGGIVKGLEVTQNGVASTLTVDVTVGACYDDSADRAELTVSATLVLTSTGKWGIGVKTGPATISASAIAIPSAGDERILSLYLLYGELYTDDQTDLGGIPVKFETTPSLQFELREGSIYTAPPSGDLNSSRDALANGRVLIGDIVLENSGGTLQWKTNGFCPTNDAWDTLGYGLDDTANLHGRRSDWISLEDETDFPAWRSGGTQHVAIREDNARKALDTLCQLLAGQAATEGSTLLGIPAIGGSQTFTTGAASVTLGTVYSALGELLVAINGRVNRGGDTMQPPAAAHGLTLNPTNLDADRALLQVLANVGGAVGRRTVFGRDRGHPAFAHDMFDDFLYIGDASNALPNDGTSPWHTLINGTGTAALVDQPGGVVRITSSATGGHYTRIATGLNATTAMRWWNVAATPWAIAMFRVKLVQTADTRVRIGFFETNPETIADSSAYLQFDSGVDVSNWEGVVRNTTGTAGTLVDVGTVVDTAWHTFRIASRDNAAGAATVMFQHNNNAWVAVDGPVAGAMNNGGYTFGVYIESLTTAAVSVDVDQAFAGDGVLADDMAPAA